METDWIKNGVLYGRKKRDRGSFWYLGSLRSWGQRPGLIIARCVGLSHSGLFSFLAAKSPAWFGQLIRSLMCKKEAAALPLKYRPYNQSRFDIQPISTSFSRFDLFSFDNLQTRQKSITSLTTKKGTLIGPTNQHNGAVWSTADVRHLPWSLPKSKVATMSAFFLYGALYGGAHQLCHPTGKKSTSNLLSLFI